MRISRDEWGLALAEATSRRGTCLRRAVGCVLVDAAGHVLATGYNGVARDLPHCNHYVLADASDPLIAGTYPNACPAASAASGTELDGCQAIHAEINAIIQCRVPEAIYTCYTTTEPCVACTKALMNTGCSRVVFRHRYPHPSRELWLRRQPRSIVEGDGWLHLP